MNWLKDPTPAGLPMYLVILCIISAVVVVVVSPAMAVLALAAFLVYAVQA